MFDPLEDLLYSLLSIAKEAASYSLSESSDILFCVAYPQSAL